VRDLAAEEFTAFVAAAGTRLERSAVLLTGDHHLAEDLAQVTLAKVWAAWRRINGDPLSYARRTLLHAYISHRRLHRSSERPVDWVEDHSEAQIDTELRLDVLNALAGLKALDRAVVVLRYWEDRSVADTAQDLDLTEAAVRTRAKRALRKLQPLLANSERTMS
jgi:RNA polymerase sigma-70 factor (sigma-E family)